MEWESEHLVRWVVLAVAEREKMMLVYIWWKGEMGGAADGGEEEGFMVLVHTYFDRI